MTEPLITCDVCGTRRRSLLGRGWCDAKLCSECFERLDGLDRAHVDPAFPLAVAIIAARECAARLQVPTPGPIHELERELQR